MTLTTRGESRPVIGPFALALLALLLPARAGMAQTPTVTGSATALQATVIGLIGGTTTALADTGPLVDDGDARAAELASGSIALVGNANVLHAVTLSAIESWSPGDEVASESSLTELALSIAGSTISAGFAMAQASAPVGGAPVSWSTIEGLSVNGVPIAVTGAPNQTVSLPGLTLVLNEVQDTATSVTVNALHLASSLDGTDVVVASATAGIGP
jgi:hypothetical protein